MSINIDFTDPQTGQQYNEIKIKRVTIGEEIAVTVDFFRKGYLSAIKEHTYYLSRAEFEAAEATTEHSEFINVCKSKAYVVLDAKVFNPPEPEPEPEAPAE